MRLTFSNINFLWKRVHKLLGQKPIQDLRDDGTSMMSTKMKSVRERIHLASLIGIHLPFSISDCREPPRPAVAPFSESDQNGILDELQYPPERKSEEEDEVMMDFVSGR